MPYVMTKAMLVAKPILMGQNLAVDMHYRQNYNLRINSHTCCAIILSSFGTLNIRVAV